MNTLALCVLGKDAEEVAGFAAAHQAEIAAHVDELVLVVNPKGRFGGMAAIGNRALDATRSDVFGLVHGDTSFHDGALSVFKEAVDAGFVAGVVGRTIDGRYIWAHGEDNMDDRRAVTALDGCAAFFDRSTNLRFDEEEFDSFHCVVEDLALAARNYGIPLIVPKANAGHRSSTNFAPGKPPGNPEWLCEYAVYVSRLKAKWTHLPFMLS